MSKLPDEKPVYLDDLDLDEIDDGGLDEDYADSLEQEIDEYGAPIKLSEDFDPDTDEVN